MHFNFVNSFIFICIVALYCRAVALLGGNRRHLTAKRAYTHIYTPGQLLMDIGGKCCTACNFRENIFIYRLPSCGASRGGVHVVLELLDFLFSLCAFPLFEEIFACAQIHLGFFLPLYFCFYCISGSLNQFGSKHLNTHISIVKIAAISLKLRRTHTHEHTNTRTLVQEESDFRRRIKEQMPIGSGAFVKHFQLLLLLLLYNTFERDVALSVFAFRCVECSLCATLMTAPIRF